MEKNYKIEIEERKAFAVTFDFDREAFFKEYGYYPVEEIIHVICCDENFVFYDQYDKYLAMEYAFNIPDQMDESDMPRYIAEELLQKCPDPETFLKSLNLGHVDV